jgi:hypothetical protein
MACKRQIVSFILSMLLPWQQTFNTKVANFNVQESIVNVSNKFRLHVMQSEETGVSCMDTIV